MRPIAVLLLVVTIIQGVQKSSAEVVDAEEGIQLIDQHGRMFCEIIEVTNPSGAYSRRPQRIFLRDGSGIPDAFNIDDVHLPSPGMCVCNLAEWNGWETGGNGGAGGNRGYDSSDYSVRQVQQNKKHKFVSEDKKESVKTVKKESKADHNYGVRSDGSSHGQTGNSKGGGTGSGVGGQGDNRGYDSSDISEDTVKLRKKHFVETDFSKDTKKSVKTVKKESKADHNYGARSDGGSHSQTGNSKGGGTGSGVGGRGDNRRYDSSDISKDTVKLSKKHFVETDFSKDTKKSVKTVKKESKVNHNHGARSDGGSHGQTGNSKGGGTGSGVGGQGDNRRYDSSDISEDTVKLSNKHSVESDFSKDTKKSVKTVKKESKVNHNHGARSDGGSHGQTGNSKGGGTGSGVGGQGDNRRYDSSDISEDTVKLSNKHSVESDFSKDTKKSVKTVKKESKVNHNHGVRSDGGSHGQTGNSKGGGTGSGVGGQGDNRRYDSSDISKDTVKLSKKHSVETDFSKDTKKSVKTLKKESKVDHNYGARSDGGSHGQTGNSKGGGTGSGVGGQGDNRGYDSRDISEDTVKLSKKHFVETEFSKETKKSVKTVRKESKVDHNYGARGDGGSHGQAGNSKGEGTGSGAGGQGDNRGYDSSDIYEDTSKLRKEHFVETDVSDTEKFVKTDREESEEDYVRTVKKNSKKDRVSADFSKDTFRKESKKGHVRSDFYEDIEELKRVKKVRTEDYESSDDSVKHSDVSEDTEEDKEDYEGYSVLGASEDAEKSDDTKYDFECYYDISKNCTEVAESGDYLVCVIKE